MTTSPYDAYRPPDGDRRRRRRRGGGPGRHGPPGEAGPAGGRGGPGDRRGGRGGGRGGGGRGGRGWMNRGAGGGREMPMAEAGGFASYDGRPIVKAPPWGDEIGAYLFLGGLAGGSALLGLGAQLTDRPALRRNTRLTALAALGVGTLALVEDLGRPERFLNMMRTVKITSPMSLGSWILGGFATCSGVLGALEVDRMTQQRVQLGVLRRVLSAAAAPAALGQAALAR